MSLEANKLKGSVESPYEFRSPPTSEKLANVWFHNYVLHKGWNFMFSKQNCYDSSSAN